MIVKYPFSQPFILMPVRDSSVSISAFVPVVRCDPK
uniref:Uncharacterized protein n=1 Tax=Anguilla anguilla TaxID=7936 RepID=A0A0E9RQQ2_ANGAN